MNDDRNVQVSDTTKMTRNPKDEYMKNIVPNLTAEQYL